MKWEKEAAGSRVPRDTRNRRGKTGGPPSKPKYYLMTDRGEVPRGKGEKNPGRGVKENLKPCAYKQREHESTRLNSSH